MRHSTFTLPTADGLDLHVERWDPDGVEVVGVVQIAHGMGEHARRYARLAEQLTAFGWIVMANDHRGHGLTAGRQEVGEGGLGDLGPNGWPGLVDDLGVVNQCIEEEFPALPIVLLGHSMGSFAAQLWVLDHSADIDGLVLSGSTALDVAVSVMEPGQAADLSALNAGFDPARTDFDWLSRDDAEVDAYVDDVLCGFGIDVSANDGLIAAGQAMADPSILASIRRDLPILLIAGEADPLNFGLALIKMVEARYLDAGIESVTAHYYEGARHEVFNETNRDEVTLRLLDWLALDVPSAEPNPTPSPGTGGR